MTRLERHLVCLGWIALAGLACRPQAGQTEANDKERAMPEIHQLLAGRDFAKGEVAATQMANFAYLVADRPSGKCVLVDAAWDVQGLLDRVKAEKLTLVGAVATHAHWDHVGGSFNGISVEGVAKLVALAKVPVYVHEADAEKLKKGTGLGDAALHKVKDGETLDLGGTRLTFLHTPGHTPGCQCLRVGEAVITGDTLFVGECGRVDLAGSDPEAMFQSMRRLAALPEATVVYPGHHYGKTERSTIGEENRTNPALKASTPEAWRKWQAE
jgi:glyoxylase-like metal-dependent hydrolase (beta-lactamase superfamily II)